MGRRDARASTTTSAPRYRTLEGQTYGWDCVLAGGAAWFLDDGDGSERFSGTLRGHGVSTAPLHLVRVDLGTGEVAMAEVCGQPGGLVANPPVVDERAGHRRRLRQRQRRDGRLRRRHARRRAGAATRTTPATCSSTQDTGELVTGDHADVVVLDIATGDELARADTGSGMQSVLFPAPGFDRDFYVCSFLSVSRVSPGGA